MEKTKNKLISAAPRFLFWLFAAQPVLDAASYWANRFSLTSVTTGLRFVMLVAVALFSFAISEKKKRCVAVYAFIALFFALHALFCFLQGGYHFASDAANFLRIAQFPVFTLCFIDVFEAAPESKKQLPKAFFVILCVIVCVVALSFISGQPEFTYTETFGDGTKSFYGFRGWFEVANSQSAIIVLIVPVILFFAYGKKNEAIFTLTAAAAFANLYFYGTRFAFYSIFIICAGFVATLVITRQKRLVVYVVLALFAAAAFAGTKNSFMYLHQNNYRSIMSDRQHETEAEIEKISQKYSVEIPVENLFDDTQPSLTETGEETPDDEVKRKEAQEELRLLYTELYENYCGDMVEKFGINRVTHVYNTTNDPFVLSNMRLKKINFARLAWDDTSTMCKLFGFQYGTLVTENSIYDLENDFSGTFYFIGWLGMIPYIAFIAYHLIRALVSVIRDPKKLTVEFLTFGMTFVLILLAAQFSGNVLRRPNASIYLSVTIAYLHCLTQRIFPPKRAVKEAPDEAEHNHPGI